MFVTNKTKYVNTEITAALRTRPPEAQNTFQNFKPIDGVSPKAIGYRKLSTNPVTNR